MVSSRAVLRTFPAPEVVIVPATDLGGVDVLKHGDLYLLTDPFGDIHPDTRGLGLYAGDTRVLSCAVVRINGFRPSLLRGDSGDNYHGSIQATNPELRRDPGDKTTVGPSLARQSLGIARHRTVVGGLREELVIANYTDHVEDLEIELTLGADMADIFEVRGYRRAGRGTLQPIVVDPTHVSFAYVGLDERLRRTFVAFPEATVSPVLVTPDGPSSLGGSIVVRWHRQVGPGEETRIAWSVWADAHGDDAAAGAPAEFESFPVTPRIDAAAGAAAYAAWSEGAPRISSDSEPFDRIVARGLADLRLLLNDGPDAGEHYLAAGVPWFATLFGRDAIISAYESIAFRPAVAIATLEVLAAHQATV
ncbi:MAG TPA: glycogen debranching N-terminal domain-containing protein, partial [Candidatus Acidoferrum sp.]|nr:glycogen debranching N-terminal domain-containing protein [Candidatus Acidoferrum sp.]